MPHVSTLFFFVFITVNKNIFYGSKSTTDSSVQSLATICLCQRYAQELVRVGYPLGSPTKPHFNNTRLASYRNKIPLLDLEFMGFPSTYKVVEMKCRSINACLMHTRRLKWYKYSFFTKLLQWIYSHQKWNWGRQSSSPSEMQIWQTKHLARGKETFS